MAREEVLPYIYVLKNKIPSCHAREDSTSERSLQEKKDGVKVSENPTG